jgi:hypothetical protein
MEALALALAIPMGLLFAGGFIYCACFVAHIIREEF